MDKQKNRATGAGELVRRQVFMTKRLESRA